MSTQTPAMDATATATAIAAATFAAAMDALNANMTTDTTTTTVAQPCPIKKITSKPRVRTCCFNDVGGPWPRNLLLLAASSSDIKDRFMTLVVGADEIEFVWFREILCFHSRFFASAIKHDCYTEAKEMVVHMPEDSPAAVREFMRWITDHRIGGHGPESDNPSVDAEGYWDLMIDLYVFGGKYGMPRIQNVAVNEMISLFQTSGTFPRAVNIDTIYEYTCVGAPLRNLVVNMVVLSHDQIEAFVNQKSSCGESLHPEFVSDMFKRLYKASTTGPGYMAQRRAVEDWQSICRCIYHVSEVVARSDSKKFLECIKAGHTT